MKARRALFLAASISISAAFAAALPEPKHALEVTYYYLPG